MNPGDDRFEDLYKRFGGRIYVFLIRTFGFSRDKAEDLAQEAFLRVYRNMERYRGDAEWSYLEAVAKRVALNAIRAGETRKRKGEEVVLDERVVDSKPPIEETLDLRDNIERLRQAIEELPPALKICLKLRLEELTVAEVAKVLNLTVDAVKSRLRSARDELRERLGADVTSLGDDDDDQQG